MLFFFSLFRLPNKKNALSLSDTSKCFFFFTFQVAATMILSTIAALCSIGPIVQAYVGIDPYCKYGYYPADYSNPKYVICVTVSMSHFLMEVFPVKNLSSQLTLCQLTLKHTES